MYSYSLTVVSVVLWLVCSPQVQHIVDSRKSIDIIDRKCRVLGNNTVSCDQILYQDVDAWKYHKDQLDDMIQEYRKMLENLRVSLMQSFFSFLI
jgi:hypothetical protein